MSPTTERNPYSAQPNSGKRTLRDMVLDSLDEISVPTYSQQVATYLRGRFRLNAPIAATRFGSLSYDEEKAFDRGSARVVWLCHGLTFDRGQVVRRLWARSDWSLDQRIIAPKTGRVLFLQQALAFCKLAAEYEPNEPQEGEHQFLKFLAADFARDLLGSKVRRGSFELEDWMQTASRELEKIAPDDSADRAEAAERLSHLSAKEQLFGSPVSQFTPVVRTNLG